MSNATLAAPSEAILNARDELARPESSASAVSWGAIVAGAVVASALSCAANARHRCRCLRVDHQRLGHDVRDPRSSLVQFASGVGGYLGGRLRTRWVSVHTDEVYFRDTPHGLIVWSWRNRHRMAVSVGRRVGGERGRARWRLCLRSCRNWGCGTGCASCRPGALKRGKFGGLSHRHAVSH